MTRTRGIVSIVVSALAIVVPATATAAGASQEPGASRELVLRTPDGRERTAQLYVPAPRADDERPLLVALHGGTGSGTQFRRTSELDRLADEHGFLVVYPDGVGSGALGDRLRTWNGGVCCGSAARQGVDDVTFLRQLVETIAQDHAIDPNRVFATGHSNGMIMAYRLLCDAADVFAAAAGQAGTLGVEECRPSDPVSLRHIHGTADTNLPIDGGPGTGISAIDFPSPRDGVRALALADGCPQDPATTTKGPAITRSWRPCDGGTVIEFVAIQGANHAWMGAAAATRPGGAAPFPDYDASRSSWEFLAKHPRTD